MKLDFQVDGLEKLSQRLAMRPKIKKAIKKARSHINTELRKYPPERPKQKYKRTYKLRDAWKTEISSDGLNIRASNYKPYSPFVMDADRQAWMHKDRWATVQDVIEKRKPGAVEIIQDALEEELENDNPTE